MGLPGCQKGTIAGRKEDWQTEYLLTAEGARQACFAGLGVLPVNVRVHSRGVDSGYPSGLHVLVVWDCGG